jgi:hypothetical protein
MFRPGAKIGFTNSRPESWDISAWGPALENLGPGYEQILAGCAYAGIPLSEIQLADLTDEEFARSVAVLSAFAHGTTLSKLMPGFLLGPAASDPKFDERTEWARFEVPVVMNVKERGLVVWVTGGANVYVTEDRIVCGFDPAKQTGCRVEHRARRLIKQSNTPEVWVDRHWPAIRLLDRLPQTYTWDSTVEHELEGSLSPVEFEFFDHDTPDVDAED